MDAARRRLRGFPDFCLTRPGRGKFHRPKRKRRPEGRRIEII